MKTYTAFLIMNAVVLGTSSLSATEINQERPNEEKTISRSHSCSWCEPQFSLSEAQTNAGKGNFELLPKEMTQNILLEISVQEVLKVSRLSKAMHNLCRSPLIWERLALNEKITLLPFGGCINEQFRNFALFSNPNKSYKITIAQLKSFKTMVSNAPKTYKFEVRNGGQFELENSKPGPDGLEYLSDDAYVTFMPGTETSTPTFHADIIFCSHIRGKENSEVKNIKDLSNRAYKTRCNRVSNQKGTTYFGNSFVIRQLL